MISNKDNFTHKYFLVAIVFLMLPLTTVYAANFIDFNTMLSSLKANAKPVIALVKAIGYVSGFWLVISALQELKMAGQSRGMGYMPTSGAMGRPLMRFAIGAALVYLPSTIDLTVATLWGSSSILEYQVSSDLFGPAKEGIFAMVQVIGYISFIRGFMILSRSTHQGGQQGTMGKGIVHIIGGILAINIEATINVIKNSLGFTS